MEYKGKVYAKIAGKYIECTETIQELEYKINKLKFYLEKVRKYYLFETNDYGQPKANIKELIEIWNMIKKEID